MTIAELHADEALRAREFPVARDKIFLGHAAVSPLPRRVAEAVKEFADLATGDDQETVLPAGVIRETRQLAARLLHAQPEEISFVGPTSLALSYVASGFPVRKGDNILIYHDDYPSNVYPWMALAPRGVEVRLMNVKELGRIRAVDVIGQVDENTRLVALASCHFVSGWRLDVAEIGRLLRARGIAFCVDAIQTLGAFPTTVEHVDFLAADAHKWLLGPCAAGILYVRKEWHERLRPPIYGWHNVRCPNYVAQEEITLKPDGRRYEAGSGNLFGIVALKAVFEMLLEVGIESIAAELLRKRAWLVPVLQERGWSVWHAAAPPPHASAILTLHKPDADLPALHRRLREARIITSLREDRAGQNYLRLSPHFYNTDVELHRFLEFV
jgi:selenocysteine lyase/cysteine desulfurase